MVRGARYAPVLVYVCLWARQSIEFCGRRGGVAQTWTYLVSSGTPKASTSFPVRYYWYGVSIYGYYHSLACVWYQAVSAVTRREFLLGSYDSLHCLAGVELTFCVNGCREKIELQQLVPEDCAGAGQIRCWSNAKLLR